MDNRAEVLAMTCEIVASYVANNSIPMNDITPLVERVYATLSDVSEGASKSQETQQEPAVPIKKSITQDYLICLEDGKKFKTLRRHLKTKYNMTPEEYRKKWGLPVDYPMVAPNYSKARSDLARSMGLGQRSRDET